MIKVLLEDTLRSGKLGPLEPGMTPAQIEEILGPPDAWGPATSRANTREGNWKYGNIEFHFSAGGDRLQMIFSDTFDVPEGGEAMEIDPWILRSGLPRDELTRELGACGVEYQQVVLPHQPGVTVITSGGGQLYFVEAFGGYNARRGLEAIILADSMATLQATAIPLQYRRIGRVEHFWDRIGVVGFALSYRALVRTGDRIAFRLPPQARPVPDEGNPFAFRDNFVEQIVDALWVADRPVDIGRAGELVTLKTDFSKHQMRQHVDVYLVNSSAQ